MAKKKKVSKKRQLELAVLRSAVLVCMMSSNGGYSVEEDVPEEWGYVDTSMEGSFFDLQHAVDAWLVNNKKEVPEYREVDTLQEAINLVPKYAWPKKK